MHIHLWSKSRERMLYEGGNCFLQLGLITLSVDWRFEDWLVGGPESLLICWHGLRFFRTTYRPWRT